MGKMIDLLLISCVIGGPAMAGGADRLLPPASDFRLTLVEDPQSTVPLGASCTGEAELTLTCRAFTLTLENIGKKSVRLSWSCNGPDITLDEKNPNSTSGWWPESQLQRERCAPGTSMNLRLKPGEQKRYTTRLMAPPRFAYFFPPRTAHAACNMDALGLHRRERRPRLFDSVADTSAAAQLLFTV